MLLLDKAAFRPERKEYFRGSPYDYPADFIKIEKHGNLVSYSLSQRSFFGLWEIAVNVSEEDDAIIYVSEKFKSEVIRILDSHKIR